jgi:hypothetical protein
MNQPPDDLRELTLDMTDPWTQLFRLGIRYSRLARERESAAAQGQSSLSLQTKGESPLPDQG